MKLPRTDRYLKATVAVAVLATLSLTTAGCRKKSDAAAQADHGSTAGTDSSMSGMRMPTPSGEHTDRASSSNELVTGRSPVDLDQAQRQFINIRTRAVTNGDAVVTIRAVGIVSYNDTQLANVNARIMGWAQKLYVDKPGQFVKQGDP